MTESDEHTQKILDTVFDENISDWGEDCFEKYYRKLKEEDRRIEHNLPLLWEDGKWELNRQQRNYVGEEV